jgi:phosphate transport system substrate-binding protein
MWAIMPTYSSPLQQENCCMKKLFTIGSLAITAALVLGAGNLTIQNTAAATAAATTAATSAATQTPLPPPATPSSLATADANLAVAGSGKIKGPLDGEAQVLNARGATFPLNLYANWNKTYKALTNVAVNYIPTGSGDGRTSIIANTVDFAGSDFPMNDDEVKKAQDANGPILHIPTTLGAIVAVYNIPELKGKAAIQLTGDNLADIYDGKVTKWNDDSLVANNPDLKNVNQKIKPVWRVESSGTTQNFTTYLALVNKNFADTVKAGPLVNFPVGTSERGNPGVAKAVKDTTYAVGYVELSYAGGLSYASLKNGAGKFIVASSASVTKAALGVTIAPDLRTVIIGKSTDPDAYPISVFTWVLVYQNQTDASKATALTRYLWWATHDGQVYNASLGYAPLPQQAVALDESQIMKINVNGKAALPADIATPGAMMASTMAATMAGTMAK